VRTDTILTGFSLDTWIGNAHIRHCITIVFFLSCPLSLTIFHSLKYIFLQPTKTQFGIGSLWQANNLITSLTPPCTYTSNTKANSEYQTLSGCTSMAIPIEQYYGMGTACEHWDEICFRHELMTGIQAGTMLPLSRITIAGLEDIGFTVDYSQADAYTVNDLDPSCVCQALVQPPLFRGSQHQQQQHQQKKQTRQQIRQLGGQPTRRIRSKKNPLLQRQKAKLSWHGYKSAVAYGKLLLAEKQQRIKSMVQQQQIGNSTKNNTLVYIGHHLICILYVENGVIFSIWVKNDNSLDV